MSTSKKTVVFFLFFNIVVMGLLSAQNPPPPNSPAIVLFEHGQLSIRYDGRLILSAHCDNRLIRFVSQEFHTKDQIEQAIVLESMDGQPFTLQGMIYGSEESFSCESDYPVKSPTVLRFSVGLSHSLLNRAVYDRQRDCLLSFDLPNAVEIMPDKEEKTLHRFRFGASSHKLIIRFRPRYYQLHKGLIYFEPWNYAVWDKSIAGWSSWYAYLNKVTEKNIHDVADSISSILLPYGYQYIQIDDGYQQEPIGKPDHWLHPNAKFPMGLDSLSHYISGKGLIPGIWTNVSCSDSVFAFKNPQWFVKNKEGIPVSGEWIGYIMDGSNKTALEQLILPVYSGLRNMGWHYFKLDALRHLKYEGYNTYADYFLGKSVNRDMAYRDLVMKVRAAIGNDSYLLGCWGIRPELAGIIDGCRIGNDGFSYAGLGQFNSFNNVVWRNDPDHVELTEASAFRSCTVTSLTGSVLLLTDKPEQYQGHILEAARRTAPVLFVKPGQIYEIDPSRMQSLQQNDREVSGNGPRIFDAGYSPSVELYSLEINRPFENWLVLGRLSDKDRQISMQELGLETDTEYEVFEFWTKSYLGSFKNLFIFPEIDTGYHCQVFCFRKKQEHPQLLATNRHISCGGPDLKDCSWDSIGNKLSGRSDMVGNDDYIIYIQVPSGYTINQAKAIGCKVRTKKQSGILELCLRNDSSCSVEWEVNFLKSN